MKAKCRYPEIIIALEDLDFLWDTDQAAWFREMWESGETVPEIARALKRPQDEVLLLIIHEARQGRIKRRREGLI